jgi:hypothetical protein
MSKQIYNILKLKDSGIGKDVLIIGGGTSVQNFRFDKLKYMDFFGVNFQFLEKTEYGKNVKLTYQIYADKSFSDLSKYMYFGNTQLIGFKPTRKNDANQLSVKSNYFYDENTIQLERDSCHYAIQICKIINYNNIYIIGLDGYSNWKIHYWGDKFSINGKEYFIHENEKKMIEKVQFKKMVKYYDDLKDYKNVYNLNPNSKIKAFPFRDITC